MRSQVINVAVSGQTDEKSLKAIAERVRDEITDLPEVSQVELSAARPYEIAIEVSEHTLRRYGLTFDEVAQAVRRSSLDLPGGTVKTSGGEISLRTKGQPEAQKKRKRQKNQYESRPAISQQKAQTIFQKEGIILPGC